MVKLIKKWGTCVKLSIFQNSLNLTICLSLIFFFFYNHTSTEFDFFIKLLIVLGVATGIVKHFSFWIIITIVLAVGHLPEWYSIDNHVYLLIYWALNLSVVLYSKTPERTLQKSSKLLLGFCFLFAAFWKLYTPEFINGSFFYYILAGGDNRFISFSIMTTDMTSELIDTNRAMISSLKSIGSSGGQKPIIFSYNLYQISQFVTWWTIALEGLIAILFLTSFSFINSNIKHYLLILFILTTYPVAPVIAFGMLLVCLALPNSQSNKIRIVYLVIFAGLNFI